MAALTREGARAFDVVVIGGGLLGGSIAWGLAKSGARTAVLDRSDQAIRASRANFALIWVQSKGLGLAPYSAWTIRSAKAWPGFAAEIKDLTGLDVAVEQPGGFSLCLSERELEARKAYMQRLMSQPGMIPYEFHILDRQRLDNMLPGLGPEVVGGSYCPLDGHVNSLRLYRALFTGLVRMGATVLPGHDVSAIAFSGGEFRLATTSGEIRAAKIVLAAGNANAQLAPMVGLEAPMKPERGQVIVTERAQPFLKFPIVTLRQTDEGTVMIGDSKEEGTSPDDMTLGVNSVMADRAVRFFPRLGSLNVVRTWTGIRVMTADGFPVYDQSETCPGAFVACCHSGVTLAANHALSIGPMIAAGQLDPDVVAPFSARRFHTGTA
jgi:glycine/D-amino acid oxidase-like deaminating enzyme